MNYFWGNVFEYFKERRYAAVFFGTLMAMAGALLAGAILYQIAGNFDLLRYWPFIATVMCLWFAVAVWRGVRRSRAERRNRYKISAMSRDELTKARSKLLKR